MRVAPGSPVFLSALPAAASSTLRIMLKPKSLIALAATVTLVGFAVTGCAQASEPDGNENTPVEQDESGFTINVSVPHTDTEVTLSQGDILEVDFGTINTSIGDEWTVTAQPDPNILVNSVRPAAPDATPAPPGSDTEYAMYFEAVGAGETSVTFQYTYRGTETTPADGPGTTTLTVTVE